MSETILSVSNLHTHFFTSFGVAKVINGVNLSIAEGGTVGIVGESGAGKSVLAHSIINLVRPPGRIVQGEVIFKNENLLKKDRNELQHIRGNLISLIVPHPGGFLNPLWTVGDHITKIIQIHQEIKFKDARLKAIEMLEAVGINDASNRMGAYPHELSGGMQQRILIAMGLVNSPELIIADGPTTGLDVTIQAQVLELIDELLDNYHASMILIERDLGLIAQYCNKVGVLYAGRIIEFSDVEKLFLEPLHPYTQYLLASARPKSKTIDLIPGQMPSPFTLKKGCAFRPRCPLAIQVCDSEQPAPAEVRPEHWIECHVVKESLISESSIKSYD